MQVWQRECAVIAEMDALSRTGLAALLRAEMIVASAEQVTSFDALVSNLAGHPDIRLCIIGAEILHESAQARISLLRSQFPHVRIVVIARTLDRQFILDLLSAGIHGCVPRSLSAAEIGAAFRAIMLGQVYLPPALCDLPQASGGRCSEPHCSEELTGRQAEVLEILAAGKSNKQIARDLGISEGTVKVHVNAAFRILGVHNRVSAVTAFKGLKRGSPEQPAALQGYH